MRLQVSPHTLDAAYPQGSMTSLRTQGVFVDCSVQHVDSDDISQAMLNIATWIDSSNSKKAKKARQSFCAFKNWRTSHLDEAKCHACHWCQTSGASSDSQCSNLTLIVKDLEYLLQKLFKRLDRARGRRKLVGRGCQILGAVQAGLKIASFVTVCIPSAAIATPVCVQLMAVGDVAFHLLEVFGKSLDCKEENLLELIQNVICVQDYIERMTRDYKFARA